MSIPTGVSEYEIAFQMSDATRTSNGPPVRVVMLSLL